MRVTSVRHIVIPDHVLLETAIMRQSFEYTLWHQAWRQGFRDDVRCQISYDAALHATVFHQAWEEGSILDMLGSEKEN